MKDFAKKFILQPGPVLSIMLICLMVLSGLLYYRAIKIQRFLEPALEISQPRIKFSRHIRHLISKEFGAEELKEIKFESGSIFVEESMLFAGVHNFKKSEPPILKKVGNIFLSALKDEDIRAHINLILVIKQVPMGANQEINRKMRLREQSNVELVLNSIFFAAPELKKDYSSYFAATVIPMDIPGSERGWVEFRIIPSELVHIELLQKLYKYMQ